MLMLKALKGKDNHNQLVGFRFFHKPFADFVARDNLLPWSGGTASPPSVRRRRPTEEEKKLAFASLFVSIGVPFLRCVGVWRV